MQCSPSPVCPNVYLINDLLLALIIRLLHHLVQLQTELETQLIELHKYRYRTRNTVHRTAEIQTQIQIQNSKAQYIELQGKLSRYKTG